MNPGRSRPQRSQGYFAKGSASGLPFWTASFSFVFIFPSLPPGGAYFPLV
jgi:hypothetical protein